MKRKYVYAIAFTFFAAAVFSLSACGRGNRTPGPESGNQLNGIIGSREGVRYGMDTAKLTIFTPFANTSRLQESADNFAQTLENTHLQVDIIDYTPEERDEYHSLLLSKFAAGVGPDIFVRDNFLLYPFIENSFITDIFAVIDESQNFTRDHFFTNVLDGIAVNSRLYTLPVTFSIDYVGINANAPASFVARFADLNRVSPVDMAELYMDLVAEHLEWADFALIHGFGAAMALHQETDCGVDFNRRTANFAPFIDILETIRSGFYGNLRFATPFFNWQLEPEQQLAVKQERYLFSRVVGGSVIYGLFEFRKPYFVSYIPLSDAAGRLVNRN